MKLSKFPALCALTLIATLAATACLPPPEPPPGWNQTFITRDGADVTDIRDAGGGRMQVTAPRSNVGSDSRSFFWLKNAPTSGDHVSCATTTHSGLPVQEGVALRLAPSTNGQGTRGITVQKNIAYNVDWTYNVHTWDTSRPGRAGHIGSSIDLVAQFQMHEAIPDARTPANPRRLCARVIGDVVEFKVWGANRPEPEWGDPTHSRKVKLPAGWTYPGKPGLYIGHVPPGGNAVFSNLEHGPLPK